MSSLHEIIIEEMLKDKHVTRQRRCVSRISVPWLSKDNTQFPSLTKWRSSQHNPLTTLTRATPRLSIRLFNHTHTAARNTHTRKETGMRKKKERWLYCLFRRYLYERKNFFSYINRNLKVMKNIQWQRDECERNSLTVYPKYIYMKKKRKNISLYHDE